jgi:hypothetical protein
MVVYIQIYHDVMKCVRIFHYYLEYIFNLQQYWHNIEVVKIYFKTLILMKIWLDSNFAHKNIQRP